jgi:urease accessory protein
VDVTTSLHPRSGLIASLVFFTLTPQIAYAHVGILSANGWEHGVLHPLLGIDHLVVMLAVGIWARQLGGRATWLVPLSFVSVMVLGGMLGMSIIPLPCIEIGILMSLLVLGVLIGASIRLPLTASMALVGLLALFHGYAHGTEMPRTASGLHYALGFITVTTLLHITGIGMSNWLQRKGRTRYLRWAGISMAGLAGVLFFAG